MSDDASWLQLIASVLVYTTPLECGVLVASSPGFQCKPVATQRPSPYAISTRLSDTSPICFQARRSVLSSTWVAAPLSKFDTAIHLPLPQTRLFTASLGMTLAVAHT